MNQSNEHYQYWELTQDNANILWIAANTPGAQHNTINGEALNELEAIVTSVSKRNDLKGIVFYSLKPSSFFAGADIGYFSKLDKDASVNFVAQGQRVLDAIAHLSIPTAALIRGTCLGGGLELALACRYRIAVNDSQTRLGLPEVRLGIFPAWAGIRRLPELIGALRAIPMILRAQIVDARTALSLGLVDAAISDREHVRAVHHFLLNTPKPHQSGRLHRLLNLPPIRRIFAEWLRRKLHQKMKEEHYPAPYRILDLWDKNGTQSGASVTESELEVIRELMIENATAKNLVRVFNLQENLKKLASGYEDNSRHVHVVGAGTMGGDIAIWCAASGFTVTLQDQTPERLAGVFKRAQKIFKKKLKNDREVRAAFDRLIPDVEGNGIKKADIIIEAVFEEIQLKQRLWKEIEQNARPDALLATNTSSIPLEEIAQSMKSPERLLGVHFFNPVAQMQLVEIVQAKTLDQKLLPRAYAFVRRLDRLPLPVKSAPGFLVNRLLMPYFMESIQLLEEGVPAYLIDQAAEAFGMPMGPIELADTVGLDVCLAVAENLIKTFKISIPQILRTNVAKGNLGRKTEKGFYRYHNGRADKSHESLPESGQHNIMDRLFAVMFKEALACLEEGIVADADILDAGIIFGAGFAPFRGGLMMHAQELGTEKLKKLFLELTQQYGDRFNAALMPANGVA